MRAHPIRHTVRSVLRRAPLAARVLAGLAVIAAVVFAVLPTKAAPPKTLPLAYPGEILGVTANSLDGDTRAEQDLTRALGVGWLREEFRWSDLEPARGRYDFSEYDRLVSLAAQRGLRVLPVLIQTPRWLSPRPDRLPPDLDAWRRFVTTVARRYGSGGSFWRARPELDATLAASVWEVWNEPYLRAFDDLGPRPGRYAELVKATVQAGRAVDPKARFITAAETTYEARSGQTRNWLQDVAAEIPGFGAFVDLLGVHPYTPGDPLAEGVPRVEQLQRFDDLQRTLLDIGIGRRPLWLTELGWSTCTVAACVSEAQQEQYWRKALEVIASDYRDEVEAVFPYRLTDIRGTGPGDSQAKFGLVTLDGRRKPAFGVIGRAAAQARVGGR